MTPLQEGNIPPFDDEDVSFLQRLPPEVILRSQDQLRASDCVFTSGVCVGRCVCVTTHVSAPRSGAPVSVLRQFML